MIALDTNVLIRYITLDDANQSPAAVQLIDSLTQDNPGFVPLVVVAELTWVLEGYYKFDKADIVRVIDALLQSKEVLVDQKAVVAEALQRFSSGNAGLADYLIECGARAAGCTQTFTFDRKAVGAGMVMLKHSAR